MNLRKRSIKKTLKEDSEESEIESNLPVKSTKKRLTIENLPEDSNTQVSKYFSEENRENKNETDNDSEDEFVEIKPVKAKSKIKPRVDSKKSDKPTTSKKANAKTEKKTETKNEISNKKELVQQSPKFKSKIENDIDALLNNERNQKMPKIVKNNDQEDEDEDDFEEVEMENLHEVDMHIAKMSRDTVEVRLGDKKNGARKKVDLAVRMERIFKALNKKYAISAIKTHLICW